ncbi:hypothetical protein RU06_09425 [Curtobacterium flaccumfaciens]|nr:hypothetical protein RU06_09425 [Curtobacterium flaccumfaciens]
MQRQVGLGPPDHHPAESFHLTVAAEVTAPLLGVGPVVVALVLDDDAVLRVGHVDTADEPTGFVEHVDLQFGLGQPRPDDRQPRSGLLR